MLVEKVAANQLFAFGSCNTKREVMMRENEKNIDISHIEKCMMKYTFRANIFAKKWAIIRCWYSDIHPLCVCVCCTVVESSWHLLLWYRCICSFTEYYIYTMICPDKRSIFHENKKANNKQFNERSHLMVSRTRPLYILSNCLHQINRNCVKCEDNGWTAQSDGWHMVVTWNNYFWIDYSKDLLWTSFIYEERTFDLAVYYSDLYD